MRLLQIAVLCFAWMLAGAPKSEAALLQWTSTSWCENHHIIGTTCYDTPAEASLVIDELGNFVSATAFNRTAGEGYRLTMTETTALVWSEGGGASMYFNMPGGLVPAAFQFGCCEGIFIYDSWSTGEVTFSRTVVTPLPPALALFASAILPLVWIGYAKRAGARAKPRSRSACALQV